MNVGDKVTFIEFPIWKKQPGETIPSYQWFCLYMDEKLSGGSYKSLVEKKGKKPGYRNVLEQWATKFRWAERIDAYQKNLWDIDRKAQEKARQEMAERQANIGVLLQQRAAIALKGIPDNLDNDAELALKYLEVGAKIERIARGGDTLKIDATLGGRMALTDEEPAELDVSQLTTEEWETYKALSEKMKVKD